MCPFFFFYPQSTVHERRATLSSSMAEGRGSGARSGVVTRTRQPLARLLCVEDEPAIRGPLEQALLRVGFAVDACGAWRIASRLLADRQYDAILLDRGLPDADGVAEARRLRQLGYAAPIILFTGHACEESMEAALESGINHVLPKPQLPPAVAKQIERILLETRAISLRRGDITLEGRSRRLAIGTRESLLSPQETEVLWELMMRPGVVLSRGYLLAKLGVRPEVADNLVSVLVRGLRDALGPGHRGALRTVRRQGYAFDVQEEGARKAS